jgi:1,4-alpha-glucan branching enzyme
MGGIWWELTGKRAEERTISYAECHDQALVGDKTIIFRLMDKEMYFAMNNESQNDMVERGIALHKLIRLATAATAGDGYLNFMGNEFGHPEWIDFPREGNGWSYKYARRQWSLADNGLLRYGKLQAFDSAMVHLLRKENILSEAPELLVSDEEKKILVFRRKNCIFAVNFSPSGSFADYGFSAPAGEWVNVLDSDQAAFDGFSRLKEGERHISVPGKCPNGNQGYNHTLYLYLPARTAMVLKKV